MTTVLLGETINWSIQGIADSDIVFVSRNDAGIYPGGTNGTVTIIYAADIRAGRQHHVTMRMTPSVTDYSIFGHQFLIDIPSVNHMVEARIVHQFDTQGPPGEQSFGLTATYLPNQIYSMIVLGYFGTGSFIPGVPSQYKDIEICIIPKEALSIGFNVWRKGLPPCPADFMPPLRMKPEGCAKCSDMGLPSYRVNTATLNLVVQDTDFAGDGPGPVMRLTRTYNADPESSGMFGRSWSFAYESRMSVDYEVARVDKGTGQALFFAVPTNVLAGAGVYTNWDGRYEGGGGGETDTLRVTTDDTGQTLYQLRELASGLVWAYASPTPFGTNIPLAYLEDLSGNRLSLDYDTQGRIATIRDAAGRTASFFYNAQNLCTRLLAPNGAVADYAYTNGNLTWTRDLAGTVSTFDYLTNHYLSRFSTEGRTWTVNWEAAPWWRVGSVTDPLTNTVAYSAPLLWTSNRVVYVSDGLGAVGRHYSKANQVWKTENGLGQASEQTFLTNGLPATNRNARGIAESMAYDERRNLAKHIAEDGAVTTFGYDANDRMIATTNALGGVTRIDRDARGLPLRTVLPSGREFTATYNSRGQVLTRTDPAGNTTGYTYSTNGLLVAITDAEGFTTRFGYDTNGLNITSVTNALGFVTQMTWDANRRPLKTIHPDGTYREVFYDCCAPSAHRDENGRFWNIVRDGLLRPTQLIDPMGRVVRPSYDARGNLTKVQDADGRLKFYEYDLANRMVGVSNALGVAAGTLGYDENGNVVQANPGNSPLPFGYMFLGYDGRDRLSSWSGNPYAMATYTYDLLGRLSGKTNARSQVLTYTYDADDHLLRTMHGGITNATYTYSAGGVLQTMTDQTGTTVFHHDRRQLVTNIVYPDGLQVTMRYDGLGRLTTLNYPGGAEVSYAHDSRGRVTNMTWSGQAMTFGYDATGRLLSEGRPNGATSQYAYDPVGRLTNLVHQLPTNLLVRLRYERNGSGEVTNVVKVSGVLPVRPPFTPTTNTFSAFIPGLSETWNGTNLSFDMDGNRLGLGDPPEDDVASYDAESRLLSLRRETNTWVYTYDGLGRIAQAMRNGKARKLHYDQLDRLLFETDAAGKLQVCYFYRGQLLVALWSAQAGLHYYHFDHVGSTLALSDSTGRISASYRYLPYGEMVCGFARVENRFTFVGRHGVRDEGQGFYFMKARFYDSRAGRFVQRDPVRLKGGLNLYAYAGNNPLNYIDPAGRDYLFPEDDAPENDLLFPGDDPPADDMLFPDDGSSEGTGEGSARDIACGLTREPHRPNPGSASERPLPPDRLIQIQRKMQTLQQYLVMLSLMAERNHRMNSGVVGNLR